MQNISKMLKTFQNLANDRKKYIFKFFWSVAKNNFEVICRKAQKIIKMHCFFYFNLFNFVKNGY